MYVVLPCTSSLLRVDCGKCQENCTLVNCPRLTFDTLVIFCPTTTFIVINCKCERSVFQHFRIFVPKRRRKKKSKLKKGTSRFDALYKELKWLISFLPLFRTILFQSQSIHERGRSVPITRLQMRSFLTSSI